MLAWNGKVKTVSTIESGFPSAGRGTVVAYTTWMLTEIQYSQETKEGKTFPRRWARMWEHVTTDKIHQTATYRKEPQHQSGNCTARRWPVWAAKPSTAGYDDSSCSDILPTGAEEGLPTIVSYTANACTVKENISSWQGNPRPRGL